MVQEILNAMLWQARLAIRSARARAFAAHGYVDPAYRPPRLPFVSVVGPLSLHVEPERENGRLGQARVLIPGYVLGQARSPGSALPASGSLRLRFDGRASVTLSLAGLPATPFGDPSTGPAVARAIGDALGAALLANAFRDDDGTALTDPVLLAALSEVTVRWNAEHQQLMIASDRGTASTGMRSSVEVLSTPGDLARELGLSPVASASIGRQRLHRLPPPRSMTVDTRLDLWAHTQGDLATMFDGLAYAAPTRGRLVLRPSLLMSDIPAGATSLRLLERGEPTTRESLVHLEGGDGLRDRACGVPFTLSAGASSEPAASRFALTGAGQIAGTVWSHPLLPDPLFQSQPAPAGFALALGVALDAAAADNDTYSLVVLRRGATTVLQLVIHIMSVTPPGGTATSTGEIVATATLGGNPTETRWRLPLHALQAGGTLHATLGVERGTIALAWNGEAQRLDDPVVTPSQPIAVAGAPMTGTDMVLTLGGGASAPLPHPVAVSFVHLLREPVGPLDPRVRTSLTAASRLLPGDMIALSGSEDGWRLGEDRAIALVDSVLGNEVVLTRPVSAAFARGRTLVYQDECFFYQTAIKRRDDLMNQLYHCSVDYKVSALLEDPAARTTAVLVQETHEELTTRGLSRAPGGHPGVSAVDAEPARGVN